MENKALTKIGIAFGVSFFVKVSTETEYSKLRHGVIIELVMMK